MRAEVEVTTPATQYLTFSVADEEYALPALKVREILAYMPLTRVPRAPGFICGVMNLRGSVVPVVDLRMKLGLPATPITSITCIVIVDVRGEQGDATMAFIADEVRNVVDLRDDEIEPAPSFGTRIDLSFLQGMGDAGDHFALILDADKVLTTLELIAAQRAAAEVAEEQPPAPETQGRRKRKNDEVPV